MVQRGQHQTGEIVAAGAGNVRPALSRTGGGCYHALPQIMFQRGQHRSVVIVAAGALNVSPARFRTGGGCYHGLPQIMVQCGQLFAGGIVTTRAGIVSIPADFRTAGGFCIVMHQIMIIWVFFAVFPTTHLTDRFGGAGCCAAETACSINFGAVVHAAADVRAVAGG